MIEARLGLAQRPLAPQPGPYDRNCDPRSPLPFDGVLANVTIVSHDQDSVEGIAGSASIPQWMRRAEMYTAGAGQRSGAKRAIDSPISRLRHPVLPGRATGRSASWHRGHRPMRAHLAYAKSSGRIGSFRSRFPVAAKMALATAGITEGVLASPIPPGAAWLGTMCTSTTGISSMRRTS